MSVSLCPRVNQEKQIGTHLNRFKQKFVYLSKELNSRLTVCIEKINNIDTFNFKVSTSKALYGIKSHLSAYKLINLKVKITNPFTLAYGVVDPLKGAQLSENINWTRGRFSGSVVSIVVSNGLIQKKTYITPRGAVITVKRSELGCSDLFKLYI